MERLTSVMVSAMRSYRYACWGTQGGGGCWPGIRLAPEEQNAIQRPSALMFGANEAIPLAAVMAEPSAWLTSRTPPLFRSQRKTSSPPFPSLCPGTRLGELLRKATKRPSALMSDPPAVPITCGEPSVPFFERSSTRPARAGTEARSDRTLMRMRCSRSTRDLLEARENDRDREARPSSLNAWAGDFISRRGTCSTDLVLGCPAPILSKECDKWGT